MMAREVDEGVAAHLAAGRADDAATVVVRSIGPHILGYLRGVLRDSDDADDAFARWAEGVWVGIAAFRGEASLETWCHRIAWHSALRILRDPHHRKRRPLPSSAASRLAAEVSATTASHLGTTAQDRIAELRRVLSPEEQTLLVLRLDRGLAWRDIVLVLAEEGVDVNEAALRKRYERLKDRVRDLAIAHGLLPR
jgi:RNA polymerase sigma-70 factor (ECF subfamily)